MMFLKTVKSGVCIFKERERVYHSIIKSGPGSDLNL